MFFSKVMYAVLELIIYSHVYLFVVVPLVYMLYSILVYCKCTIVYIHAVALVRYDIYRTIMRHQPKRNGCVGCLVTLQVPDSTCNYNMKLCALLSEF